MATVPLLNAISLGARRSAQRLHSNRAGGSRPRLPRSVSRARARGRDGHVDDQSPRDQAPPR
jgi:hypothetical protein